MADVHDDRSRRLWLTAHYQDNVGSRKLLLLDRLLGRFEQWPSQYWQDLWHKPRERLLPGIGGSAYRWRYRAAGAIFCDPPLFIGRVFSTPFDSSQWQVS